MSEHIALKKRVRYHYLKSASFRVLHVDGAYGSISPRGYIALALFSERVAIPQVTEDFLTPQGKVEEDRATRVVRDGFVREVEAEALLDIEAAEALRDLLSAQIENLKTARKALAVATKRFEG